MSVQSFVAAGDGALKKLGGPRTKAGKEVVRYNAVQHGVLSPAPVIPGIESPEQWEAHRDSIVDALSPVGAIESALAERVALMLWRLGRVARYEREAIAIAQETAAEDAASYRFFPDGPASAQEAAARLDEARQTQRLLTALPSLPGGSPVPGPDAALVLDAVLQEAEGADLSALSLPSVPGDIAIDDFDGWTAGLVREAIAALAAQAGSHPAALQTHAIQAATETAAAMARFMEELPRAADRLSRQRLIPSDRALNNLMRYEAHLNRLLFQALRELEAIQVRRQGGVAPLARLDIQGIPEN